MANCLFLLLNSVIIEWLAGDEEVFGSGLAEIMDERRVRRVPDHVIGHERLLLLVERGLSTGCPEVFCAHPFGFALVLATDKLLLLASAEV